MELDENDMASLKLYEKEVKILYDALYNIQGDKPYEIYAIMDRLIYLMTGEEY